MNKFLKVSLSSSVLTAYKMLSGFIIAKLVAIYAGPTGIAILGQLQSFISVITSCSNSAVSTGVVKYTAEGIENGYEYCAKWWKPAFKISIFLSTAIILVVFFFSKEITFFLFKESGYQKYVVLAAISLPINVVYTLSNSIINGMKEFKRFIYIGMLSVTFNLVLMVLFMYLYGLVGALIITSINTALLGIVTILCCFRQKWFRIHYWWGKVGEREKKNIIGFLLITITSALVTPVMLIIVRILLISHVGWQKTGEWQAVWKISEAYLSILTTAIGIYYLPHISSLTSKEKIIAEIKTTQRVTVPIVMVLALLIFIMRNLIIEILFSNDFKGASELFLVQLIGDVIKVVSWLYACVIISKGKVKLHIVSELIFLFLMVIMSFILIPKCGAKGANYAYLVSYIIYFSFVYYCSQKILLARDS